MSDPGTLTALRAQAHVCFHAALPRACLKRPLVIKSLASPLYLQKKKQKEPVRHSQ